MFSPEPKTMIDFIQAQLRALESREGIRILYACESGSRAWGFPSADSDYDVRFLYVRPPTWYLSIEEGRDVLEVPIENSLDLVGWDLKKALRLLRKWNIPLLEWLDSPLVYLESSSVADQMRSLVAAHFSAEDCLHHYWHFARGNYHKYFLKGGNVTAKKYLYVIRPLLAVRWLEQGLGRAPTRFDLLRSRVNVADELKREIEALIAQKQLETEHRSSPCNAVLDQFIEGEFLRLGEAASRASGTALPLEELNRLFRSALHEIWG